MQFSSRASECLIVEFYNANVKKKKILAASKIAFETVKKNVAYSMTMGRMNEIWTYYIGHVTFIFSISCVARLPWPHGIVVHQKCT